jgi:hypothetical protein
VERRAPVDGNVLALFTNIMYHGGEEHGLVVLDAGGPREGGLVEGVVEGGQDGGRDVGAILHEGA